MIKTNRKEITEGTPKKNKEDEKIEKLFKTFASIFNRSYSSERLVKSIGIDTTTIRSAQFMAPSDWWIDEVWSNLRKGKFEKLGTQEEILGKLIEKALKKYPGNKILKEANTIYNS
jgi:hypothetical protein